MATLAQARQLAGFTAQLYRAKVVLGYQGHLRHDELALLMLHPGRDNPYPLYERLRERGPLVRTRVGPWVATSHPLCNLILRDRRFGVAPEGAESNGAGLSFLEMNPPDHTRLRRLAAPAFSPKQMAGYVPLIEKTVQQLLDDLPADGRFDLVSRFAAPLPIAVISALLGVPAAHADDFAALGRHDRYRAGRREGGAPPGCAPRGERRAGGHVRGALRPAPARAGRRRGVAHRRRPG